MRNEMKALSLLPMLAMSGCGLFVDYYTAEIEVDVKIEGTGTPPTYQDEVDVNTDDYEDVKNNRDKIQEGTLEVRDIVLGIRAVKSEESKGAIGWTKVYVAPKGSNKPSKPQVFVEGMPLLDNEEYRLEIPPKQITELGKIVFENSVFTVWIEAATVPEALPVELDGFVRFLVEFKAGA